MRRHRNKIVFHLIHVFEFAIEHRVIHHFCLTREQEHNDKNNSKEYQVRVSYITRREVVYIRHRCIEKDKTANVSLCVGKRPHGFPMPHTVDIILKNKRLPALEAGGLVERSIGIILLPHLISIERCDDNICTAAVDHYLKHLDGWVLRFYITDDVLQK